MMGFSADNRVRRLICFQLRVENCISLKQRNELPRLIVKYQKQITDKELIDKAIEREILQGRKNAKRK